MRKKIEQFEGGKEKGNILQRLSAPLPVEGIQRTRKEDTKKGYNTTGYGYQFCVDRFNEVCGEEWGYNYKILKEIEGQFRSGSGYFEIVIELEIWVKDRENIRKCVGGHLSASYADALKGAITNAFKKTASFWGVGREAYAGTIDEDNVPQKEGLEDVKTLQIKEPQKNLLQEMGKMLMEMANGDREKASAILEEITTWTNKEGKIIEGKNSLRNISGKQIPVIYGKVKKLYQEWKNKDSVQNFENSDHPDLRSGDIPISKKQVETIMTIADIIIKHNKVFEEVFKMFLASEYGKKGDVIKDLVSELVGEQGDEVIKYLNNILNNTIKNKDKEEAKNGPF